MNILRSIFLYFYLYNREDRQRPCRDVESGLYVDNNAKIEKKSLKLRRRIACMHAIASPLPIGKSIDGCSVKSVHFL